MGTKTTALTQLITSASNDVIPIVDVSDPTQAASGTTKYIERDDLPFLKSGDNVSALANDAGYKTVSDFANNGEAATANRDLGNTDAFGLSFITNGVGRINILSTGEVGIGTSTPTEKLEVVGGVNVNANIANQLYVSNSASFVGVKTTAPLSTEAFRVVGEGRASGFCLGSSSPVSNRYAADAGGSLKFGSQVIKDDSNSWYFESSTNTFKFRNNLNAYSLLQLTPSNALFESKDSSVGTTLENETIGISSSYYNGSVNLSVANIKNTAIDVAGAYKLGFEVGGSERVTMLSGGNVGIGTATPTEKLEVVGNIANGLTDLIATGTVPTTSIPTNSGFYGNSGANVNTFQHVFGIRDNNMNGFCIAVENTTPSLADKIFQVGRTGGNTQVRVMDAVTDSGGGTIVLSTNSGETVFNDAGNNVNFRIAGDTDANLFKIDAGLNNVGFGVSAPTEKVDVNGSVNTNAPYKTNGNSGVASFTGAVTSITIENGIVTAIS